jgi:hypothetical protein
LDGSWGVVAATPAIAVERLSLFPMSAILHTSPRSGNMCAMPIKAKKSTKAKSATKAKKAPAKKKVATKKVVKKIVKKAGAKAGAKKSKPAGKMAMRSSRAASGCGNCRC